MIFDIFYVIAKIHNVKHIFYFSHNLFIYKKSRKNIFIKFFTLKNSLWSKILLEKYFKSEKVCFTLNIYF